MRGDFKDHPQSELALMSMKKHVNNFTDMLTHKKTRQPTLYGWIFITMLLLILIWWARSPAGRAGETDRLEADRPDAGRFPDMQGKLDPQEDEFKKIMEQNFHGGGPPKIPEFDPNKHRNMHEHDPMKIYHMKTYGHPSPKEFPVDLVQEPRLSCINNQIQLIVLVNTRADGTGERAAIRRTWGEQTEEHFPSIKGQKWLTIFVMGVTESRFDESAATEAKEYGDILQGQFKESPFEMTRKIMMAMKWLNERMEQCIPEFVLITNDNIFHNMPTIIEWLDARFKGQTGVFAGKLLRRDRPLRNPKDPLYVPEEDFKDEVFPNIIQGPEYLISSDAYVRMNEARKNVVPIAMEDAYLGLLAHAAGIVPVHNDHFLMLARPGNVCHTLKMFFIYKVVPFEHLQIFTKMKNAMKNNDCPEADMIELDNMEMKHKEIKV